MLQRGTLQYVLPLAALYVSRYIDDTNAVNVLITRVAALLCLAGQFAAFYTVRVRILAANDETELVYPDPTKKAKKSKKKARASRDGDAAAVDAAVGGDHDDGLVRTTVADFDMATWKKELNTTLIGAAVIAVMHMWLGMYVPLLVHCVTAPATMFESPLVQIHLLRAAATGDLARPFTDAPGVFGLVSKEWSSLRQEMSGTPPPASDSGARGAAAADAGEPRVSDAQTAAEAAEAFRRRFGAPNTASRRR